MLPTATPLRLACVPCLWGAIGLFHCHGAPLLVASMAVFLAAGLGLAMVLLPADDASWNGLLAAVFLATSPLMEKYWAMPRGMTAWDALTFLKTNLVLGGLLLLARLEAGAAKRGRDQAGDPE